MRGTYRLLLIPLAVLVAATCSDGGGPDVVQFDVILVTPHPDDRAVSVRITGPVDSVAAAPGFRLYRSTEPNVVAAIIIPDGTAPFPAAATPVAIITSGAQSLETDFTAEVTAATSASYELREVDDYVIPIIRRSASR